MVSVATLALLAVVAAARPLAAPPAPEGGSTRSLSPACVDGVVKDDGVPESGYGWVPSVIDGRYVQQFNSSELPGRRLDRVCICWLRTHADADVDFEIHVYADAGGVPALDPILAVPATATAVPDWATAGGRFYEVEIPGFTVPSGTFYVGAKWNPSLDQFFFICADKSEGTEPVGAFFIDDRDDEWTSVFEAQDPIFLDFKALMVRLEADATRQAAIPVLSRGALVLLVALLAIAGALLLRRVTG